MEEEILGLRGLEAIQMRMSSRKLDMCIWNSAEKSRPEVNIWEFSAFNIIAAMGVDKIPQSVK